MGNAYTAGNQLQKWLTSQGPISRIFNKEKTLIRNYLSPSESDYIVDEMVKKTGAPKKKIKALVNDTIKNIDPILMLTHGRFEAIDDTVFSIDNTVFSSKEVCQKLKEAEYVFPHVISSGKEIEDYALVNTDKLHRQIIRQVCVEANLKGQMICLERIKSLYDIKQIQPLFPGETGWGLQGGIRIFDIFGDLLSQNNLFITDKGMPNVAYTCYGLYIAN